MSKKRKICVTTGSRAEYGLLTPILEKLKEDTSIELQLMVTGAHLSPIYGNTVDVIEADGFTVDAAVEMELAASTPVAITKTVGLGMIGAADALKRLCPDVLVILGDRFEMLAMGSAALLQRIPIAHIHGGEVTAGAFDEAIRHALTKMAHLHLVAAQQFGRRVVQLGEHPDTVRVVGAPGLDNIRSIDLMDRGELEADLGITLSDPLFLTTFHPVTLERRTPEKSIDALLSALASFEKASIVFTGANPDTRSDVIYSRIDAFVNERTDRAVHVTNLGQRRYLSLMKLATAVVGNSSSGIIEAPYARTPTVDIGMRQAGRPRAKSIVHCDDDQASIHNALNTVTKSDFWDAMPDNLSLFGDGFASERIVSALKEMDLSDARLLKKFYDVDFELGTLK